MAARDSPNNTAHRTHPIEDPIAENNIYGDVDVCFCEDLYGKKRQCIFT